MRYKSDWEWIEDWLKICGFVFVFCGFWMFAPPIIVLASIFLSYSHFFTFGPCVLLYLIWFAISFDWPERGCMPWYWFRTHVSFMTWGAEYFNYRIVKTADLPPDRNYIVGSHPHGMASIGMIMSFASYMSGINVLYKGLQTWGVTLAGQFYWPLRRELLMVGGGGIASKKNLKWILGREEKGQAVAIVIGGLNEAIVSQPGKYHLKLLDRKGFIKIALTEGADLVPMFHFGENETYEPGHLLQTFGFCIPILIGRSLLGLPWGGLVPLQVRLESVIGAAIRVEKNENPSEEEVNRLHATYCEKLIDLFETHKRNYGIRPEQRLELY